MSASRPLHEMFGRAAAEHPGRVAIEEPDGASITYAELDALAWRVRARLAADPGGDKGEFTLIVGGPAEPAAADRTELERLLRVLLEELPASQAARLAARLTGVRRAEAYALAERIRGTGAAEPTRRTSRASRTRSSLG